MGYVLQVEIIIQEEHAAQVQVQSKAGDSIFFRNVGTHLYDYTV